MFKLGELLVDACAITPAQLEQARCNQSSYGGQLGAWLVELKLISEDDLAATLGKHLHLAAVTRQAVERIPSDVAWLIDAQYAERYRACPVRLERNRLYVAVADPFDKPALDAIAQKTGHEVRPMIAPDTVIDFALKRHFGVAARNVIAVGNALDVDIVLDDLPAFEAPVYDPFATVPPMGESRPSTLLEVDAIAAPSLAGVLGAAMEPARRAPALPRLDLRTFAARLLASEGQDDLADATLAYLAQDFSRVALVLHRAGQWVGRSARAPGLTNERMRAFSAEEGSLPVLMQVLTDGKPCLSRGSQDAIGSLASLLGEPGDDPILILPMRCKERPVGCFVGLGGADVQTRFTEYVKIALKLDLMLQILVLKRHVLGA